MSPTQASAAPAVILVRTQMAENIGAAARAMSNFGLTDLRLVAPLVGANGGGWPHGKAIDMASGGEGIVRNARVCATMAEALEGIHTVYAATARRRDLQKPVVLPEEAGLEMQRLQAAGRRCAFLFGPERTGLENDDLVLADSIVTIPTGGENFSLNLAQAVVVLAYCWHRARVEEVPQPLPEIADKQELQGFFDQLEGYLDEVDHFRTEEKKPIMWRNLQTIFVRAQMNKLEVQSLRGVIRALYIRRKERID